MSAKKRRHYKRVPVRILKRTRPKKFYETLEYQLCEVLQRHCGERGFTEGAVDTLERIIRERNAALEILALDRLDRHPRL